MITDKESNFVYFSTLLEEQCPTVFGQLKDKFNRIGIKYDTLYNTKDIWAVDFMPLQVKKDHFIQYTYDPDYLKTIKLQKTKTRPEEVTKAIGLLPRNENIVIDGGNIVKSKNKVIITTKVFKENPTVFENDLINEIKSQLQVEQVIVIPQEPKDFVGHADGMVRFIDENTVLVNHYPTNKIYQDFAYSLRSSLRNAGLNPIAFPYNSWQNEDANDATGCYINFLEIGDYIFLPAFADNNSDFAAMTQLDGLFKDRALIQIDCSELAKLGGVLNCATWNILK